MTITASATTKLDGRHVNCAGLHHSDRGEIVRHDRCGGIVVKREDGRLFELRISYSGGAVESFTCWNSRHTCNPEHVATATREREAQTTAGKIVKGGTVRVVKGRKVPIGTEGVVIWTGESYGVARIGIRDAAGQTHWTAESNCVAI